jgi:hypothetical protein
VSDVEKRNAWALGSDRRRNDTSFTRAVQGGYVTGTRLLVPQPGTASAAVMPGEPGLVPDPLCGQSGRQGNGSQGRLGSGVHSERVHVRVIADVRQLLSVPLDAIADDIARISLTRFICLDSCNELPGILDLLSAACSGRAPPRGLTQAHTAFLKALYASAPARKLNLEEGEMRQRMIDLLGPQ